MRARPVKPPIPHRPPRPVWRLPILAVLAFACLGAAVAEAAPNLAVTAISNPPPTARQGGSFTLKDVVASRGTARAGASDVRFYLAPDARRSLADRRTSTTDPRSSLADVLLGGARHVPALAVRATSAARRATTVRVPGGVRPGLYAVLACADDRGAVAESSEVDNCRAAARKIRIVGVKAVPTSAYAYSDIAPQPTAAEDIEQLQTFKPLICAASPYRRLGLAAAIASSRAFITRMEGADALPALARSSFYGSAAGLQQAAVAAVVDAKPAAALAALLRAHDLQPTRASHLMNAGVVATAIGLPSEGLALIDASRRLDETDGLPMGLTRQAVELANRGMALASLGRSAEAGASLKGALAADPDLSEAAKTLVGPTLCTEGPQAARPYAVRGRVRNPGNVTDDSKGKATALRPLMLPGFPRQAADWKPFYTQDAQRISGELTRSIARRTTLEARLRNRPLETRAESQRRDWLFSLVYTSHTLARMRPSYVAMNAGLAAAEKTRGTFFGEGTGEVESTYARLARLSTEACTGSSDYDTCYRTQINARCRPALRLAHSEWVDHAQEAYDAAKAYVAILSKRQSGVAAHLADPDAHALMLVEIADLERGTYGGVLQEAMLWTHDVNLYRAECVDPVDPPATPAAGTTEAKGDPCPEELHALKAVLDIGPIKIKGNCEKITLSGKLESGFPFLAAFGEVTYDFRKGEITVFAGSKAEASAGPFSAGFKSGLYLTVSNDGIEDVGWRVGPSVKASGPATEFELGKDDEKLSFIGALEYAPWH